MRPIEHYDPNKTAAIAADKTSVRLILEMVVQTKQNLRHLDTSSAFTAEEYEHNKPVYVRQQPRLDG